MDEAPLGPPCESMECMEAEYSSSARGQTRVPELVVLKPGRRTIIFPQEALPASHEVGHQEVLPFIEVHKLMVIRKGT
jgi:hypothetical protein